MLKTMVTLIRGRASAAAEDVADRNALIILDQQMRDAQAALARSQRALALAMAEDAAEARRATALAERMAGLEQRTRAALAAGREDLAQEAASAIAELEHETLCIAHARTAFGAQIGRLRRAAAEAQRRMAELHRGRRLARVAEAVNDARRDRVESAASEQCTFGEAEATLTRLRDRQMLASEAADAMDAMPDDAPSVEARMAEAGFGPALRPTAGSVLARLRNQA